MCGGAAQRPSIPTAGTQTQVVLLTLRSETTCERVYFEQLFYRNYIIRINNYNIFAIYYVHPLLS